VKKSIEDVVPGLVEGLSRLQADFPNIVTGEDRTLFEQLTAELQKLGLDRPLAQRLITLRFLPGLLDVLRLARTSRMDPLRTAEAYYLVGDHFGFSWLRQLLRTLPQSEAWEKRFAHRLAADLQGSHGIIAEEVLSCEGEEPSVESCLEKFEAENRAAIEVYRGVMDELRMVDEPTLPAIAVGVRALTDLATAV
jgi:glutamate dehydrogenase